MPRANQGRDLTRERSVAARVAYERELREWSLETMAKTLTEAGCPIPASAIYKIEKGDPPRSITLTEFLTFAAVFDLTPEELLEPVEVTQSRALQELFRAREATAMTLRKDAEYLDDLNQRVKATAKALGQSVPDGDVDVRRVNAKDGRQLIIQMKAAKS